MSKPEGSQEAAVPRSRPLLVSIIAVLVLLAALFALVIGSVTYTSREALLSILQNQTATTGLVTFTADTVSNIAFLLVGYGVIHLAIAWGLWTGKNWARIVSLALSLLGLITLLPALLILPEVAVPVVVFAIIVLYYFTRPRVKEFFKS